MEKNKNIRKTFILTEGMVEKIKQLQEKLTYKHEVDVVMLAVNNLYKEEIKEVKPYALARLASAGRTTRTPEEKALEQVDIESAKLKAKEDEKKRQQEEAEENGARICRELFGEEIKDNNGNRKCVYNSYAFTNPQNATKTERIKYLDELSDDDIENQYYSTITNEPMPADQVMEAVKESDRLVEEANIKSKKK